MKKAIKIIALAVIILALFLFAFQKDYERKRVIVVMDNLHNDYIKYRDSTDLIINSYKDTLRIIKEQRK